MIDILHSVFRVVTLLMTAKPVGAASAEHMPELNKFHHEASLDDFYMISTVMDCPPGSILWHKHTFKDLFAGRVPPLPDLLPQRATFQKQRRCCSCNRLLQVIRGEEG